MLNKLPPTHINKDKTKTWNDKAKGMKPKWVQEIINNGGNMDDYLIIPKVKVENVDGKNTIEDFLIPIVKMESVIKESVEFNG